jgi:hypothetical protein
VAFFISSQGLSSKNLKVRGKQRKTTYLLKRGMKSIDSQLTQRLIWIDAQAEDPGSIPGRVARQTRGEKKKNVFSFMVKKNGFWRQMTI